MVHHSQHPLIRHKIAALRDAKTAPSDFRRLVRELTTLLAYEATTDAQTEERIVRTPLGPCASRCLKDSIAVVPILRAGLGMAEGLLDTIPEAQVWHIGLYRDERTLEPREYYNKLEHGCRADVAFVVDPMLATGGSAVHACELVHAAGISKIKLLSLIAAPEGIARFAEAFPNVPIHVAAIDERLTEIGFIYPGLGDAGDRQFATS